MRYYGHATGLATPIAWSDTKNVVWKMSIPGWGWSSPVIVDGKVFVTTAVPHGEGLLRRAMAFDAKTGKADKNFAVLGTNEFPSRTITTPAFLGGAMPMRTDATLYKFATNE